MRSLLFAMTLALVSCKSVGGTMSVEETRENFATWAQRELGLRKIACPEPFQDKAKARCYIMDASAEEFSARVDLMRGVLRPITGWRDDYGSRNGVFQFDGQPYEVGIGFVRVDDHWLFDGPEYVKIRQQHDPGYVAVSISGEPPRDR